MNALAMVFGGAPRWNTPESRLRVCAIASFLAIATLAGCQTMPPPPPPPEAPPPEVVPPPPRPPLRMEAAQLLPAQGHGFGRDARPGGAAASFFRPVGGKQGLGRGPGKSRRTGCLGSQERRFAADAARRWRHAWKSAAAAEKAFDDGAEIIIGPIFAQAVTAVAPIARARHVPVIGLSSDRSVGGDGVYLLSFQPETEVNRIVAYAASHGHSSFAALVPRSAYGEKVEEAFRGAVMRAGGAVASIQDFDERPELVGEPARMVARSGADAVLIGEGGSVLQAIGPALALAGANNRNVKFLGTGLWADPSIEKEPMLASGWFAGPPPDAFGIFAAHFKTVYNAAPPRIATLAYDAVSLTALLSHGRPYDRFTAEALTDPNGFAGVDGIFRFRDDGSAERGLAILQVTPDGFAIVDPAPKEFPSAGY